MSNYHPLDKEQEEIRLIRAQIRATERGHFLDLAKAIGLTVMSIFLFVLIQRPESLSSRRKSSEEIFRERAKLMLEILKEDDPLKQSLGLAIIQAAYPNTDESWLDSMGVMLQRHANLVSERSALAAQLPEDRPDSIIRQDDWERLLARINELDNEIQTVEDSLGNRATSRLMRPRTSGSTDSL